MKLRGVPLSLRRPQSPASSPVITFPWGSWVFPKCSGVNVPRSKVCGHQFEGGPCAGSFWEATEWAPHVEPAVPGGTREETRREAPCYFFIFFLNRWLHRISRILAVLGYEGIKKATPVVLHPKGKSSAHSL